MNDIPDLSPQQVILEQDRIFYDMLLGFGQTHCKIEIDHPSHGKWKLTLMGDHTIPPEPEDIPVSDKQMPTEPPVAPPMSPLMPPEAFSPSTMSLAEMDDLAASEAIGGGWKNQWEEM